MPKYLVQAKYTTDGVKAIVKEGGTARLQAVQQAAKTINGTVEACYFALGETDAFFILDVPDTLSAATASLVVNASGAVQVKTTVLLTPEEMDKAAGLARKYAGSYRPPGA